MKTTSEVWNDIIDRSPDLTPTENVVNRVNKFLFSFECGDWLYNLSPSEGFGERWVDLRETAECVAAVGAPDVAQHLMDVLRIVEGVKVQEAGTWDEFLAKVDPSQKIGQIQKAIDKQISGLWDKLDDYTVAHFECEAD